MTNFTTPVAPAVAPVAKKASYQASNKGLFIINKLVRIKARYKKDANGQPLVDETNHYVLDHFEAQYSVTHLDGSKKSEFGYQYIGISENTEKYMRFIANAFAAGKGRRVELQYERFGEFLDIRHIGLRGGKNTQKTTVTDEQFKALFDYTVGRPQKQSVQA